TTMAMPSACRGRGTSLSRNAATRTANSGVKLLSAPEMLGPMRRLASNVSKVTVAGNNKPTRTKIKAPRGSHPSQSSMNGARAEKSTAEVGMLTDAPRLGGTWRRPNCVSTSARPNRNEAHSASTCGSSSTLQPLMSGAEIEAKGYAIRQGQRTGDLHGRLIRLPYDKGCRHRRLALLRHRGTHGQHGPRRRGPGAHPASDQPAAAPIGRHPRLLAPAPQREWCGDDPGGRGVFAARRADPRTQRRGAGARAQPRRQGWRTPAHRLARGYCGERSADGARGFCARAPRARARRDRRRRRCDAGRVPQGQARPRAVGLPVGGTDATQATDLPAGLGRGAVVRPLSAGTPATGAVPPSVRMAGADRAGAPSPPAPPAP